MKQAAAVLGLISSITLLAFGYYILGGLGFVIALGIADSINPGMY